MEAMKTNLYKSNGEQHQTTRHPLQWCCLSLCLAMLWIGCKQEAKVVADINPAGTYTLVSVDGNKVPCAVKHDGKDGLTVKSGSFIINADGTCSSKVNFLAPSGSDATREVKVTYTREGSKLTMKWEGTGMTTGTVEGTTFTMNNEGMIFAYQK